jgi:hypothetical protein
MANQFAGKAFRANWAGKWIADKGIDSSFAAERCNPLIGFQHGDEVGSAGDILEFVYSVTWRRM